ncbi:hypothetical protein [Kitasatospora sp. NPDC057223]|uniref:hypothetical protein n=1 Tax=Kitasatospora sp. NPDC057223 TaxID=3346055 RepID=UPI003631A941
MTAPVPAPDGQAGPAAAPHFTIPAHHDDAPAGYVAPGMPGAPAPYAYAPLPTVARRPNPGGAVAAAVGAALVGGLAYGFVMKAIDHEIGWLVFGVAAVIAWPLGRIGGRNPVLPVAGAVLSVLALFLGQVFGVTLYLHEFTGLSVGELLGAEVDLVLEGWKANLAAMDALFYGIAVFEGFVLTRRMVRD